MAQASSAQREPSMEEILASIRRIIEDSDTTRKQGDEPPLSRRDAEPVVRAEAPATASVVDVDAFRAELRSAPEPVATEPFTAPEVVPEKRPVTLADVQAQIAREATPQVRETHLSPPAAEPVATDPEPRAFLEVEDDDFGDDLDIEDELRAGDAAEEVEPAREGGGFAAIEAAAEPPQPATVDEERWAPQPQAPKTAIISEHAGRQVAAAFGELSEAFAATRKKSFDELAEEMMRPMLQDWLDNNLPVLVERLVREEIERVARGVR